MGASGRVRKGTRRHPTEPKDRKTGSEAQPKRKEERMQLVVLFASGDRRPGRKGGEENAKFRF